MRTLVKNATLLLDGKRKITQGSILVEHGRIAGIYKGDAGIEADSVLDAHGNYVMPGMLDMHTHGAAGYDVNTCTMEELKIIENVLLREGVTGFMASLVCETHEDMKQILKRYESAALYGLLGIHLEGPYVNIKQKAVMKEEVLRDPNQKELLEYCEQSSHIRSLTIAPELPKALDMIAWCRNHNIIVNIGHSDASCQETLLAEQYGASGITHLYNAMSQHSHRAPGVVSAAVLSNLYCELIVDGFHIHEDVIRATYRMIGKDRLILITDANPCKGLPDGEYTFSGKHVVIEDGHATVKETGRIAGSTLTMQTACRNMMKFCGCDLLDIVQMACVNPAKQYHLLRGRLEPGLAGDLLVVNDAFDILYVLQNDQLYQQP